MALIHSTLMGAVAGMRSMTPLAAVARAARGGTLPADNGAPQILSGPLVSAGALALAAAELAGDKMKSAPDRVAIAGMALAPRRQRGVTALLGATAAVGAAYVSFDARRRAIERYGQSAAGVIEDAIALGSAALIARSAADGDGTGASAEMA
ncbi:MAG TPA: DUF4126 domain-containing protein [Pseudoxanthomonas sp.]|nr:DUF4126 domain-containing protein [Pseudoxanthomonas sp.]